MSAAAVLLALASAATWGIADFSGGLVSRRLPTLPVTVISQAAGFAALLAALAIAGGGLDGRSFGIGILAGLGGGAGLAAFYKALSLGTMSIVSPLVACGALVPFAISIATGERPGAGRARRRRARARRRGPRVGRGAPLRRPGPRARDRARARRRGRARPLHLLPRAREPRGEPALDARRRARRLARAARSLLAPAGASRCASAGGGSSRSRDRALRCRRERALRPCEPPRAARARLGARLALPGRDALPRPPAPRRAADAGSSSPASATALAGVAALSAAECDASRRWIARRQAPDLLAVARRPELPADGGADDPPRRGGRGRPRALAALGAPDRRGRSRPRRPALRRRGRSTSAARCSPRRSWCSSSSTSRSRTPSRSSAASSTCRRTSTPPSSGASAPRVFAGYSGWGAGPARGRARRAGLDRRAAMPADVFAADPDELWRTVLNRKGGRFSLIATMPFDPGLN